jgi:nitrate reductase NapE component
MIPGEQMKKDINSLVLLIFILFPKLTLIFVGVFAWLWMV